MRNFSVITNFGCKRKCFYCAFSCHKFQELSSQFDWSELERCIKMYEGKKIIISGGGDPLFELENNHLTLEKIVKLAKKHNKVVDIHTNENLLDKIDFLHGLGINQMVVSTHSIIDERKEEFEKLLKFCKVRAVLVYTGQEKWWLRGWLKYYSFVPKLTIRECRGYNFGFNSIPKAFTTEFPQLILLPDGDYNYYYMPDNKVYENYEATILAEMFKRQGV